MKKIALAIAAIVFAAASLSSVGFAAARQKSAAEYMYPNRTPNWFADPVVSRRKAHYR